MIKEVGNDEFCLNCMEWRKYDKHGRCIVCKNKIFKIKSKEEKNGYSEYKIETSEFEHDEDIGDNDFS